MTAPRREISNDVIDPRLLEEDEADQALRSALIVELYPPPPPPPMPAASANDPFVFYDAAAATEAANAVAPASAAAPAPASAPAAAPPAAANGPANLSAWAPKHQSMVDASDPFVCPGLNGDCFHFFRGEQAYWDHVFRKHNFSRKQLDKPENAAAHTVFKPAKRLSWYQARGVDTTYRGDDKKQLAARKRRAEGVTTADADYAKKVYGSTMSKADL